MKRKGLDVMRQSACLVLNPIAVYSYGVLFNCTTMGQASDSMTALTVPRVCLQFVIVVFSDHTLSLKLLFLC